MEDVMTARKLTEVNSKFIGQITKLEAGSSVALLTSCQIAFRPTPEMLSPAPNLVSLDSEGCTNFLIGYNDSFYNSCYIAIGGV